MSRKGSGLGLLRKEAARALREASKSCAQAKREARVVSKARCGDIKEKELRIAAKHCGDVARSAELARAAYVKAKPAETPARTKARVSRAESLEVARRDAIARVVDVYNVPELVATYAVRAAERRGNLAGDASTRWKRLADRTTATDVDMAWRRYERETGRSRPRPTREKAAPQRRRRTVAERARARRPVRRMPDVVILLDDDLPF